ncbi:MAG: ATP-dependent zinc metalloprotease FtsH [Firmicutes bacterium ADurb.Bin248]|nr:MAG: ATP-dependent zinc metalloprotease FtsH [Firmicutes bacterium ADurb.Bin248]HOG00443.1 ATP-dependent zinc metalloprotease FtsH [Clostridia bacterium]HPK16522.1 ATP-dependent zinc metalloprotease FtsH [Clostridia bacterium]
MSKKIRTPLIYFAIVLVIIILITQLQQQDTEDKLIEYAEFIELVQQKQVEAVEFMDGQIVGIKVGSENKESFPKRFDFYFYASSEEAFLKDMNVIAAAETGKSVEEVTQREYSFKYTYNPPREPSVFEAMLPYLLLFAAVGVLYYFMLRSQNGGNKVMSFGKSHARTQLDPNNKTTFDDVAGADEEKEELREVVEFMRSPRRFTEMGARIPKGVLLVGPPGTGKTLLAKAVAGEAKVPFFSISGSDFVEMFVGVGASRVRDLFNTAKKSAPAVIFIDEIDAVGRQRGAGLGGGHDEREQTLNQLLVEMDGFAVNEGIIVLAATNRPDILDPALLRPGRFDRQITVNYPDVKGREEILKVHAKGKPFGPDVSLGVLAKRTVGFTGADLENVLNEAAILAARFKKKHITMIELEEAITRTIVGPEKRSRVITAEDKRNTAYHEAGHAIVARVLPNCDPVHEISVIPRGMAAGYTMTMPDKDEHHMTRGKLLDRIAELMGGRVAESVMLSDISTGAYNDLQRASEIARKMVVEYGMSDVIGPVFLGGQTEVFIAKDWGHQRNYSEEVAARVDEEIRRILDEQFERARKAILDNREALERVVKALLEYERIDGDEFEKIFNGEEVQIETFTERRTRLQAADPEVEARLKEQEAEEKADGNAADEDAPEFQEEETEDEE